MDKRLIAVLPFLLFLFIAGLFALPLLEGKDPTVVSSALIGKQAPAFSLPTAIAGGAGFSDADLKKSASLVNVFSSTCTGCRAEQEILKKIAQKEQVPVYGIDYKDKKERLARWLAQAGNPFQKVGFDESGRAAIDWGVYGVPETFVLDAAGVIRYKHVGPVTEDDYNNIFRPLLAELKK